MTPQQAKANGSRPMTNPYRPEEQWMLDNVVADMKRGNIDHCLVEVVGGVEVWRK